MNKFNLSFFGMGFVLCVSFSNCSQAGKIELTTAASEKVLSSPQTVNDIITNCQKAEAAGKLLISNQVVNFEDTRVETKKNEICEFAEPGKMTGSGNLEIHDGTIQARYEQNRNLALPAGAVICDVQMQNNLQSFRYDDVFFFSFNGYLLATNDQTAVQMKLTPQSLKIEASEFTNFYKYDWAQLRTAPFKNEPDDYCLGSAEGLSSCSWPVSERQGQIKFNFAQSLLVSLSAHVPSENQTFSFVITGDNDRSLDCYHEKLEFAMNVKYYIP